MRNTVYLLCACFLLFALYCSNVSAAEKWPGVDESVVEKYAKQHGREASKPLINTDQGDLLLFVFLLAGAIGGFVAGYYWRILIVEKSPGVSQPEQKHISSGT
ncbi:MAG: cobalt transporter [Nitrospirae bacterium]|nr:cobalt transporter [Nitrospirota bacterium]